jgi:biopolymer transport protein TolR
MAGGGGGGELDVNINLTALLDVLTNLLFFLLMGAASQATYEVQGQLVLPYSSASDPPQTSTVEVMVGQKDLMVEDDVVSLIEHGKLLAPLGENGRIEALFHALVKVRQFTPKKEGEQDVLLVLCDKDAPYGLLKQVMMTAAEAGFAKFRMAVLME